MLYFLIKTVPYKSDISLNSLSSLAEFQFGTCQSLKCLRFSLCLYKQSLLSQGHLTDIWSIWYLFGFNFDDNLYLSLFFHTMGKLISFVLEQQIYRFEFEIMSANICGKRTAVFKLAVKDFVSLHFRPLSIFFSSWIRTDQPVLDYTNNLLRLCFPWVPLSKLELSWMLHWRFIASLCLRFLKVSILQLNCARKYSPFTS